MADTIPSNFVNTSILQSLSFAGPVDASCPSASSSTANQPEFTNRHNLTMKHAARSHVMELMSVGSVNSWSVVLRDAEHTVLDIIGDPAVIELLKGIGVTLGVAVTDEQLTGGTGLAFDNGHEVANHKNAGRHEDKQDMSAPRVLVEERFGARKNLISASSPVIIKGRCNLGSVSVMVQEATEVAWLNLLAKSIASAVARDIEGDSFLRDNTLIHQALLSHLDYHVVRIGTDGNIKAYHPIPLQDSVHDEMLDFTKHHPDGDCEMTIGERLYKCVLRTLSYPSGAPAGRLGLFRDITQQKQIEWRIRDADRISVLASLAAGIAHEIRNPLTTAKGFLQLFGERQIENPERRYIDLTIRELDRIQQLVTDFMSLARPESPRYQCIELNNVISEVINFMHPEATLHGVTIVQVTEHAPLYVHADPNQLKQVLMNVLQNALQACNAKGEVTVRTRCKSISAVILVQDTGAGLTREQLARVFQPFYTTKDSGTGLGLAICRQIMQEHGGSIQIASEVGVGTTVTLQLPVSPSPSQAGDD
ncbi:ATP-binding protein [Alicyclobacillus mengziensis]|uniref:histidine kinase n=1 Tax=Alicyclobacillus mengziensis TaxID=2931921 RepID=A0A9X7W0Q4_9BACL|nr:ATP-binding protein [Alicyclobacillus mengziensis]QSO48581.1 GHKL domain-containing protein [Alicyclobacillus mengziensis]